MQAAPVVRSSLITAHSSRALGQRAPSDAQPAFTHNTIRTVPLPCVQPTDYFAVNRVHHVLDFWAFGLVLVLSVLLCVGIKETKMVNNGGRETC